MNKAQVKGRVEEVKGKIKEVAGHVVGNKASPLIEKRPLALRKADPPSAHWMTESFGSLVKSQPSSRSGSPQEPGRGEGPSRGRGSAWGGSVGRRGGGA